MYTDSKKQRSEHLSSPACKC